VAKIGGDGESFPNLSFDFRANDAAREMELGVVGRDSRDEWLLGRVHTLVVTCLFHHC
jgi:hypothetical protein